MEQHLYTILMEIFPSEAGLVAVSRLPPLFSFYINS